MKDSTITTYKQIFQRYFPLYLLVLGPFVPSSLCTSLTRVSIFPLNPIKYFCRNNGLMIILYIIPIPLPKILTFSTHCKIFYIDLLQHRIAFILLILKYLFNNYCSPCFFPCCCLNPLLFQIFYNFINYVST
jgi:hypothetical protein